MDLFLQGQGDGGLAESVTAEKGTVLHQFPPPNMGRELVGTSGGRALTENR